MSEARATLMLSAAALLAAFIAWVTTPRGTALEVFADRGELFFPQFTDANDALSLEVIAFNIDDGSPQALKIVNRDGRWSIPSQFDYPADAKSRLGEIAAAVMTARKDDVVSQEPADHQRLGVVDPVDLAVTERIGRGTRISIRGQNERMLADLIVGDEAGGRPGYRYLRIPLQNRVYLSRMGPFEVSTAFEEWIDRDVLQVSLDEIDEIVIRNYSVDESSGAVKAHETVRLQKQGSNRWMLDDGAVRVPVDPIAINELLTRLDALRIVGVLPKPAGITATLNRTAQQEKVSPQEVRDLARKGFYVTDTGELLSNEGEVIVHTRSGIFYTLRFGQVAQGVDLSSSERSGDAAQRTLAEAAAGEHRYLFVMAAYDPSSVTSPTGSSSEPEQRVRLLHARFAPWYYIISADDFSKLRPGRAALVTRRRASKESSQ